MEFSERKLTRYRRSFDDGAAACSAAVSAAALFAAAHVVASATGKTIQAAHPEVRAQGIARRLLDGSGRLVASVARTALMDPLAADAFDAAAYSVGKLLAEAWQLRAREYRR